jgi:hypothetical protein
MPDFADYVMWLLPYVFAGVVSAAGLITLVTGRFPFVEGKVFRGAGAVLVGVLLLPPIILAFLIAPPLGNRPVEAAAAAKERERTARMKEISAERSRILKEKEDIRQEAPPRDPLKDAVKELEEERKLSEADRAKLRADRGDARRERAGRIAKLDGEFKDLNQEYRLLQQWGPAEPPKKDYRGTVLVVGSIVWFWLMKGVASALGTPVAPPPEAPKPAPDAAAPSAGPPP